MGDIWLGDLARAFTALTPRSEQERRAIAATLGFTPAALGSDESAFPATANPRRSTVSLSDIAIQPSRDTPSAPTRDKRDASPRSGPVDLPLLTPVGHEPSPTIAWPAPALPEVDLERLRAPLQHKPLLAPRSSQAVLHLLLAQEMADGPVDTTAAVETMARRHPLSTLPRHRQRTLRFGAQVLVDRGVGMQPFARDQADLINRIRALLGSKRIDVQYFIGSPERGVSTKPARRRASYDPPAAGTRVLLLSDFGMIDHGFGSRALPSEWSPFLAALGRQGCDPIALVPYSQDRLPRWLTAQLPLITWDRSATVGRVRARLR